MKYQVNNKGVLCLEQGTNVVPCECPFNGGDWCNIRCPQFEFREAVAGKRGPQTSPDEAMGRPGLVVLHCCKRSINL